MSGEKNLLRELAKQYEADKTAAPVAWYTDVYSDYLLARRHAVRKVLEIGVYRGGSLRMWRDFFPRAVVFGIDANPSCKAYEGERIRVMIGDQADGAFLERFIQTAGGDFDLIVDDGGHLMQQQQVSFGCLFPHVRPGGLYVIEDLFTSYWPRFGGGRHDSTISFLKSLVDHLNYRCHKIRHPWTRTFDPGFYATIRPQEPDYLDRHVGALHFHEGMCFIVKAASPRDADPA